MTRAEKWGKVGEAIVEAAERRWRTKTEEVVGVQRPVSSLETGFRLV